MHRELIGALRIVSVYCFNQPRDDGKYNRVGFVVALTHHPSVAPVYKRGNTFILADTDEIKVLHTPSNISTLKIYFRAKSVQFRDKTCPNGAKLSKRPQTFNKTL